MRNKIYIPGIYIKNPTAPPVVMPQTGLKGRVVDVQVLERGVILWRSGAFKNLILDSGMNEFANRQLGNLFTHCAVGTGNTPPVASQSGLVAEAARTGNYLGGAGNCGTTRATPTRFVLRRTYDFPLGALNGNYSELGFSWTSTPGNNLFSRVLIQSGGTPVSVSVSSSQQLRVVYELEVNLPATASAFSLNYGGTWGTITGNMAVQDTTYSPTAIAPFAGVNTSGPTASIAGAAGGLEPSIPHQLVIGDGTEPLAAPGSANARTGNRATKTSVNAPYTTNSFLRESSATFATTEGNINAIRSICIGDYTSNTNQHFTALLDSGRDKTSLGTLTVTIRKTWGRL